MGSESPEKDRRVRRVRFAVDMPPAEPTKRAPISMVGGRAWSPACDRSLNMGNTGRQKNIFYLL